MNTESSGEIPRRRTSGEDVAMLRAAQRHPSTLSHRRRRKKKKPPLILGWREYLFLTELGVEEPIKAKVDTGAATSSLHAHRLVVFPRDNKEWVRFTVYPQQRTTSGAVVVEATVAGWRTVKSSNGRSERRPVINTTVEIGDAEWDIDLTLARRDHMGFRMLLGRKAIRRRAVVDVSRSYLGVKGQADQSIREEE